MLLTAPFWLFYEMSESETYKELGELTKCKDRWEGSIPYAAATPQSLSGVLTVHWVGRQATNGSILIKDLSLYSTNRD